MNDKLNSMRWLDTQKISYTARTYDSSGEFHSAQDAAALLGVSPSMVYKTLVVLREPAQKGKPMLVMVAADRDLDLKALAKSVGEKKLRMATQREAESLTGLQVGGISALALQNRGFQVCLDEPALKLERIHISAGKRGIDLELAVRDLKAVTRAQIVNASAEGSAGEGSGVQ